MVIVRGHRGCFISAWIPPRTVQRQIFTLDNANFSSGNRPVVPRTRVTLLSRGARRNCLRLRVRSSKRNIGPRSVSNTIFRPFSFYLFFFFFRINSCLPTVRGDVFFFYDRGEDKGSMERRTVKKYESKIEGKPKNETRRFTGMDILLDS